MNFFTSSYCKSQVHCKICRDKDGEASKFWRASISRKFEDLKNSEFECPYGKKWGDPGIEIPKIETDPEVYSDETVFNKLGDSWTFICWLLKQNEELGEVPKVTKSDRFTEILELLDTKGKIEFVDRKGSKRTNAYWVIKNLPTKIQWKPGNYKQICYQFDAHIVTRPTRWDIQDFLTKFQDYKLIKLDRTKTLAECIKIMSESDAFVGVSSGMSHVAHSVGIPIFLATYGFDIRQFHGQNEFVLCHDLLDVETKLKQYLTDKKYDPKIYLPDPHAPRNLNSCGCLPKLWLQIKDLSGSIKDLAKYITESRADDIVYLKRRRICKACSAVDTKGERLFRKLNENYYCCGALRTENIFRDSN